MFGDFFDGSLLQVAFTPPPFVIQQVITDGPFDLFVTNPFGLGAPAGIVFPPLPIRVTNGPTGALVTQSFGFGQDRSGDGQLDTFMITEPIVPGVSPPPPPGPGTLVYDGGTAVFVGQVGPNASQEPADGSVNQPNGWSLFIQHTFIPAQVVAIVPEGGGAGVRRVKVSENNSPLPQSRVFFNYNFFNDVIGGIGDVNRYTFGAEWTLDGGCSSLDLRVPFAATIDATQTAGAIGHGMEFGNVALTYKRVLRRNECAVLSGGLGLAAPTSSGSRLLRPDGREILHIESEAVHLLPFLAVLAKPTERFFWQSFLQLDVDVNGNPVHADLLGLQPTRIGVIQDATLLFADLGAGYSLFENECGRICTGAAALLELHYSTTLQDADTAEGNGFMVRGLTNRFDVLNLTAGVNLLCRNGATLRPAMVIPLRTDDDEHFDYEAIFQANWNY
jgi:hypothetical protein